MSFDEEQTHRAPAAGSNLQVGQTMMIRHNFAQASSRVIFDIKYEGEEVVFRTWPSTPANNDKARKLK